MKGTLLIAGSRSITDYEDLAYFIAGVDAVVGLDITTVISGGARGVDTLAKEFSVHNEIPFEEYLPDWSLGKKGGPERNTRMVEACDFAIILWDGVSDGTADTIMKIVKSRKPFWLFTIPQEPAQLEIPIGV